MNRPQFLAELRSLLYFMEPEHKAETMAYYEARFALDGEDAVIAELVTPTRVVVALSREYRKSGAYPKLADLAQPEPEQSPAPEAEAEPEQSPAPEDEAEPEQSPAPEAEAEPEQSPAPEAGAEPEQSPAPEAEAEPEQSPAPETGAEPEQSPAPETETEPEQSPAPEAGAEPEQSPAPETGTEPGQSPAAKSDKQGGGRAVLFAGLCLVPGVPVLAAVLIPGAAAIFACILTTIGGLWASAYMPDALIVFGCAAVLLAAAVMLLWLGVWVTARLIAALAVGVLKARAPHKPFLGFTTRCVVIVACVVAIAGAALAVVALFTGGSVASIRAHGIISAYLEVLRPWIQGLWL